MGLSSKLVDYGPKYTAHTDSIPGIFKQFDVPFIDSVNDDYVTGDNFFKTSIEPAQEEKYRYFYHPDHLGSSSYITDVDGEVSQHIEYFPYGELFLEERYSFWNTHISSMPKS